MALLRVRALSIPVATGLALSFLFGTSSASQTAVPAVSASPTLSAISALGSRRYVAAGTRAYVVGAENGAFPPIGWHITGQMGGVWAPPIKLLDGLWFSVAGSWLDSASSFTSGPGFVRLTFPVTDGVRPTLTEFAPDGSPVVLFGLTLQPVNGRSGQVPVVAQAHSQVMAAYPWTSTTPTSAEVEHPDVASVQGDHLQFNQSGTSYYAEVGANVPADLSAGSGDWGPTPSDQQQAFGTDGKGGQLNWTLSVPATGRTLWLGVAGSQQGAGPATAALRGGLAQPGRQLDTKIAARDGVAALTDVSAPDLAVQQAILWSKLNLADLQRTVTGLQIRDVDAGQAYPAPIATVPVLSGIDAAYPDYAEFFGTDGAYATYGLAVSGQWNTAINQLNAMRTVSEIVNGSTGKVVHEINATGAVYFGDNSNPGDINETAQFAIAAGLVWRWSGNSSVLRNNYTFIKEGEYYLASLDPNPSDLWPQGDGIVEDPSLGIEAVDVASETVNALGVLHDMATVMGDAATASWAGAREQQLLSSFGQWWIANQSLYADSLCDTTLQGACTSQGEQLQQRYWTSVAPMEQDIAPPANAIAALSNIATPTFTGACGLYVDGLGGPEGASGQSCYLVNTGALAVAQANYGQLDQAVANMDKIASQLTVEMPGSLPELSASAQYNPYEAFTSRANVMQAWSSYGLLWTTVNDLLGVSPNVPAGTLSVVPELPASWPQLAVSNLQVGSNSVAVSVIRLSSGYRLSISGAVGLALTAGVVVPSGSTVQHVTLDGQQVAYQTVTTNRGQQVEVSVPSPHLHDELTVTLG